MLYELRLESADFGRKLSHLRLGVLEQTDSEVDRTSGKAPQQTRWRQIDDPRPDIARLNYLGRLEETGKKRRLLCITQSAGIGKTIALEQLVLARTSNRGHMTIRLHFSQLPIQWQLFLDEPEPATGRPFLVDHVMNRLEIESELSGISRLDEVEVKSWLYGLIRRGQMTLAVDGLDEVATNDLRDEIRNGRKQTVDHGAIAKAKALRSVLDRYDRLHCAVAGRPNAINEVLWSHLFATRTGPTHDETSEWEFCLTSMFDDQQRERVLGRTRYEHLALLQGEMAMLQREIQFNARTLEVLRVLEPDKFQTIRSTADAYWYGIERSLSMDRKKEGDGKPIIPLEKNEIIDILSAIAIVFTMWSDDPETNRNQAASTLYQPYGQTQIPTVITEMDKFTTRVAIRLGRIYPGWKGNDFEIAKHKLDLLRKLGTQYVEFRFLAADDPKEIAWRNASQRDFCAALWLVRRSSAAERDWLSRRVSLQRTETQGKQEQVDLFDIWKFLCGVPDGALISFDGDLDRASTKEDRWSDCIQALFRRQTGRPRPTELMYRCWPNLLRRAGYLRSAGWTEAQLQLATEAAQLQFEPKRNQRSTRDAEFTNPTENHGTWTTAADILGEFLGEYPRMRDGQDEKARICHEDLEDHWCDCNSHDDLYFLCGHRNEKDNPEQVRCIDKAFELNAYQMTNRLYFLFDSEFPTDKQRYIHASPFLRGPALYKTWYDATMASIFFHGRLPDEWEWEYASRGQYERRPMEYQDRMGNRREVQAWVYPAKEQPAFFWLGGEEKLSQHTWNCYNRNTNEHVTIEELVDPEERFLGSAQTVGRANHCNGFGLYDMLGNVDEYTSSRYRYGWWGVAFCVRGGPSLYDPKFCWEVPKEEIRYIGCSSRHGHGPTGIIRERDSGFRVARSR